MPEEINNEILKEAEKVFGLDNIPEDAVIGAVSGSGFKKLEDDTYQASIQEIVLKANPWYKEDEDGKGIGSKYQFSFTFEILNEGEFRGRKVWKNVTPYVMPNTRKGTGGPTILYTIVTKVMSTDMNIDDCHSFAADMRTLYKNLLEVCKGQQIRITTETIKKPDGKFKTSIKSFQSIKSEMSLITDKEREAWKAKSKKK